MLKEFAEYLVGLKENKTYTINGETYSDRELVRVAPYVARPHQITVNGLDSIVQLVKNELERQPPETLPLFIRVDGPHTVEVYSALDGNMKRNSLYAAQCESPEFREGYREYDKAIVELRSKFVPNEGTDYLLDLLSRIIRENGVQTDDNGVSQTVTARSGISLKETVEVKPRVALMPFRTFPEVAQPESEFLTRIDEQGRIGWFEADGGAWKLEAKKNIAAYFRENLAYEVNVRKVVVMV